MILGRRFDVLLPSKMNEKICMIEWFDELVIRWNDNGWCFELYAWMMKVCSDIWMKWVWSESQEWKMFGLWIGKNVGYFVVLTIEWVKFWRVYALVIEWNKYEWMSFCCIMEWCMDRTIMLGWYVCDMAAVMLRRCLIIFTLGNMLVFSMF